MTGAIRRIPGATWAIEVPKTSVANHRMMLAPKGEKEATRAGKIQKVFGTVWFAVKSEASAARKRAR